jgi:hypothetical protein
MPFGDLTTTGGCGGKVGVGCAGGLGDGSADRGAGCDEGDGVGDAA